MISAGVAFILGTFLLFGVDRLTKNYTGRAIPGVYYWVIQIMIFIVSIGIALLSKE